MGFVTDTQLNTKIATGEFAPVYFLYGEEFYLLQNTLHLLLKAVVSHDFLPFNLHRFDGDTLSVAELQTAYQALPMMAMYKCITVKNWKLDKLPKKELDALFALLAKQNPSTVLVFYYTATLDVKKAKTKKLIDLVGKQGVVCAFAHKNATTLKKAMATHCSKQQVQISAEATTLLLERCHLSYQLIQNELDKMISYVGVGGKITPETVALLGSFSVQGTAFELSDAILKRQPQKAFALLDQLFYLRIEPVSILGALSMSTTDLYRLKVASLAGISTEQVLQDFHYRSSYRLKKLQNDLRLFPINRIHTMIQSLVNADLLLKSSRMDARTILEVALAKMLANESAD